ncbi:NlpC/P60 family protein [Mariniflexile sp.]|uniref:NlpC/P60 family protein n=1 Tax=Mariniflexile sp. TaxID=1979402 RepID=UPI004047F5D0
MKKFYLLFGLILLLSVHNLQSQNDTIYVMRAGIIINKQSIKTEDVDSLIFHKPAVYIEQTLYGDTLSEEDNLFLESISVPNPEINDILDSFGKVNETGKVVNSDTEFVKNILKNMLLDAQSLSAKKTEKHDDEGLNRPLHYGIAYSYGQRNFTQRLAPPSKDANNLHRKYSVFGTDCSGLIINLLRNQGINISDKTAVENFENNLKATLSNNPAFQNVIVENYGRLPIDDIKNGDFILWRSVLIPTIEQQRHIGIVHVPSNSSFKNVFQSNGSGTPKDEVEQAKNINIEKRGVHPISLNSCLNGSGYWSTNYTILRIQAKYDYSALSGVYSGQSYWNNYDGVDNVKAPISISFTVDEQGTIAGWMSITGVNQQMKGTTNGVNISFEWLPPAAPFKYSGTFSADKKTIVGNGGAGGYYAPNDVNGPFEITKE